MPSFKTELNKNDLTDAGWVVDSPDLYFYSKRGRDTLLKASCPREDSPIETIDLRICGREAGRVYSRATGMVDLGLLEGKMDIFSALEFARAIKPLL